MTRDPNRIPKVLEALSAVWQKDPDLRLGQLILNAAHTRDGHSLFDLEDDVLLNCLWNYPKINS